MYCRLERWDEAIDEPQDTSEGVSLYVSLERRFGPSCRREDVDDLVFDEELGLEEAIEG